MASSQLHTCRRFTGRNAHDPPQSLAEGELTLADNVRVEGGDLVSRPGLWGQLTTPFSNPLYAPFPYLTANGDGTQTGTDVLFTTNGRVYHWTKGGATASEIAVSGITAGSVRSATARWARLAHFAYLTDGQAGQPLLRIDLAGGSTATALNPPTAAPTAALTGTTVDDLRTTANWAADTVGSATNRLPNANFAGTTSGGGWGSGGGPTSWSPFGANPDLGTPTGASGNWMLLDNPQEGIRLTTALANDAQALDGSRYATHVYQAVDCWQADPTGLSTVIATLSAYSDAGGTALLTQMSHEYSVPYAGGTSKVTLDTVFDVHTLDVPFLTYRIDLTAGARNASVAGTSGQPALYVQNPVAYPMTPSVSFSAGAGSETLVVGTPSLSTGLMPLAATHMRYTLPATADLSGTETLAVGLGVGTASLPGLAFFLRLQKAGGTLWYDTNPAVIDRAAGVATVDITAGGVPADVRAACAKIKIVFTDDVGYSGTAQIQLGPLTAAGNLARGDADYTVVFTEVDATADPTNLINVIESDPSPVSNALTPTALQAEGVYTVAAPVNAGTTHRRFYRTGGVFNDGLGRLICTVPVGSDTVIGGAPGLVTWDHVNRVLRDDTPDSFLQANTIVFQTNGRGAPPTGAQAVCAWNARIWLAVKGKLYASWAVTQDQQAALYFNATNRASDPLNSIKGINFSVGQDDNDPIIGLVSMGGNQYFSKAFLVVLKQHSVWLVSGTDPSNFAITEFLRGSGVGLAAARAASVVDGILWFLSAAGVRIFNGDRPGDASQKIEPDLHPTSGTAMTPAALAGALSVYHDRRLHLFAPLPGDSANTVCHVWDARQGGWTRDRLPGFLGAVTGACSLSSQTDNGDLCVFGSDGQIYVSTAGKFTDKHLPGDAGTAIAFAAKGRGVGQEGGGLGAWRNSKALRVYAQALVASDTAATITLDTDSVAPAFSESYTLSGLDSPALRVQNGVAGNYLIPGVAASVSQSLRVSRLDVETVEQAVKHR